MLEEFYSRLAVIWTDAAKRYLEVSTNYVSSGAEHWHDLARRASQRAARYARLAAKHQEGADGR
ncbi:MAG: hypothetical protein WDA07_06295 [Leucobacter sp.]